MTGSCVPVPKRTSTLLEGTYSWVVQVPAGDVVNHYEAHHEEDRLSKGPGQIELARAKEVLRRHLPPPPADVLDVGGGTGVHAAWLAADGYHVRLIDLSPRHVAKAKGDLGGLGVVAELGDARKLAAADTSYDVVLVFGPLYHLTEREDRLEALREAARVARPGAVVAVAGLSRFASLFDGLSRGFLFDPQFRSIVARDLHDGQHRNPDERPGWWTTAFFHHPDQLREEVAEAGLVVTELVGLEGLAFWLPGIAARLEDTDDREVVLWSARATESEPALAGLSAHLLVVATRPT
ncbi:MAG TPA: methyltransferase domain-containing protein [Acidimicrobiales bacterium]|nr:methyltransferase domain-containing protein [Acidimicrobiales bacterium]